MGRDSNLLDIEYVNRDGDSMRGPLTLSQEPIQDMDAATKRYVDTVLATLVSNVVLRDGSQAMTGALTLPGAPVGLNQAATKAYIDFLESLMVRLDGSRAMTGLLTLSGAPVNALHASSRAYVDALRVYVDAQDALMVLLDGTRPMTGALTLPGLPVNPLHAATKSYVDALPPVPVATYDAVVAAAGGDYTDIVTACATEAVGARIFIKRGTYNETANIQMKDGQMLVGENPEDTVIDFGAGNRKLTFQGAPTNLMVRDLTVQNSIANWTVDLSGDHATVQNCRLLGTGASFGGVRFVGQQCILANNLIDGFSRVNELGADLGVYNKAYGNTITDCSRGIDTNLNSVVANNVFLNIGQRQLLPGGGSVVSGNYLWGGQEIMIMGSKITICGNSINGVAGIAIGGAAYDYILITGNYFDGSKVNVTNASVADCTITGNLFRAGAGVSFAGSDSVISGNGFSGGAFIALTANAHDNCITGNRVFTITDLGWANLAKNNMGVDSLCEKDFREMKNTSGGALVAGDCVVFKAVAAGDEVDTTVAQGDDMVFGMLDEPINNNAYGPVQTEGKTVKLKVNGAAAIAVGDPLGTHTVAGIARQAAAGDMAFAIALEAYAVADNNGVIDALLMKPRKV